MAKKSEFSYKKISKTYQNKPTYLLKILTKTFHLNNLMSSFRSMGRLHQLQSNLMIKQNSHWVMAMFNI